MPILVIISTRFKMDIRKGNKNHKTYFKKQRGIMKFVKMYQSLCGFFHFERFDWHAENIEVEVWGLKNCDSSTLKK